MRYFANETQMRVGKTKCRGDSTPVRSRQTALICPQNRDHALSARESVLMGARRVSRRCTFVQSVFHGLHDERSDDRDERKSQWYAPADAQPAMQPLRSELPHGAAQIDFDRPKKNPRRGPHCGAPTPTPVPLRISYFSSNRLITSNRAVNPFTPPTSKLWLTPKLNWT